MHPQLSAALAQAHSGQLHRLAAASAPVVVGAGTDATPIAPSRPHRKRRFARGSAATARSSAPSTAAGALGQVPVPGCARRGNECGAANAESNPSAVCASVSRRAWLVSLPLAAALWAIILLATDVVAVPAHAHPTIAESLAIADRWAAQDAPGRPNHCAGGNMRLDFVPQITFDADDDGPGEPTVLNALGVAWGWAPDGVGGWRWDHTLCHASIRSTLTPGERCYVIAHEVMHFVIGPEHVGPLDPMHPGAVECFAQPAPAAEPRKRVTRSPAQIARSIRYRRAQAKIKARAFARAIHSGRSTR